MKLLKSLILLVALLLSISVGYSKLEQELTINNVASIDKSSSTDYSSGYTLKNKWYDGSSWIYDFGIALTYTGGDGGVTSWDATIAIPTDAQADSSLFSSCNYSQTTGNLKIYNSIYNGSVAPNGSVSFEVGFKSSSDSYELEILSVNFYSQSNPNPNLINVSGSCTLVKDSGWIDSSDGKFIQQYSLTLNNNTNYDFQEWETVIPFNQDTMQIISYWNFNYVIKNENLILFGGTMLKNSLIYAGFQVKCLSGSEVNLSVSSFTGKVLIIS